MHPWVQCADVIQLYNIHGGYLSPGLLPSLAHIAPLVWRLSDMWPITGHCAYSGDCERWRTGCGECPDLATYPAIGRDTTAWLWRRKQELYARSRITVVAPSTWIAQLASDSPLFAGCSVHHVPNGLDLEVFRPIKKSVARAALGLPVDARICLFSAQVAFDNPRKGTHILEAALNHLGSRADFVLAVIGEGGERWSGRIPQRVAALGTLHDDRLIALANAAADVALSTALTENLPNTMLEAIACGTPIAAIPSGGIEDAVRHGSTGLVASAANAEAFAVVLEEMLTQADLTAMSCNAAAYAGLNYDRRREAERLLEIYADLSAQRTSIPKAVLKHSAAAIGKS